MKITDEIRKAMSNEWVPRMVLLLEMADEVVEELRKRKGDSGFAEEITLAERLMIAQVGVSMMAQQSISKSKQGRMAGTGLPPDPPPDARGFMDAMAEFETVMKKKGLDTGQWEKIASAMVETHQGNEVLNMLTAASTAWRRKQGK